MRQHSLLSLSSLLAFATLGLGSRKTFNVHDDVLAFPQFVVHFPYEYILASDAREKLAPPQPSKQNAAAGSLSSPSTSLVDSPIDHPDRSQQQAPLQDEKRRDGKEPAAFPDGTVERYEEMILKGARYLCAVPKVATANETEDAATTPAEQEKELARAADRGLELLSDMKGRCMYYVAGWWSYSFCYMDQHLEDGTICDLTGRNRKIEVQFHCHPQSTDRIGWIKEVSTCTYLMIIYTPRLCNDVAFQPPREDDPKPIVCREIVEPDDVAEFEEAKTLHQKAQDIINMGSSIVENFPVIGGIEVGAMKLVGGEGKRIEKGKVASAGEERVEVVAKRQAGEIHKMSKEELKKFNLDADKIEVVKKQLEEFAGGKDWKLEMVEANGRSTLRVIVSDTDEDEDEGVPGKVGGGDNENQKGDREKRKQDDAEEDSDEILKEEL
ncbi:hypothetical protein EMCG_09052 [[Emmonsia] crescens]|uniref:Endoplasmic reticulum lectin n=1 Tax=[Emmonsia] crescens TaxID=73230 RepID=A0A0G2J3H9_9EURO|nr:hypothetical protein EMCG_09052 [Emmonsia crescens UAMH 3008]